MFLISILNLLRNYPKSTFFLLPPIGTNYKGLRKLFCLIFAFWVWTRCGCACACSLESREPHTHERGWKTTLGLLLIAPGPQASRGFSVSTFHLMPRLWASRLVPLHPTVVDARSPNSGHRVRVRVCVSVWERQTDRDGGREDALPHFGTVVNPTGKIKTTILSQIWMQVLIKYWPVWWTLSSYIPGFPKNGNKSHFPEAYKGKFIELYIFHIYTYISIQLEYSIYSDILPACVPPVYTWSRTSDPVASTEGRGWWQVFSVNFCLAF